MPSEKRQRQRAGKQARAAEQAKQQAKVKNRNRIIWIAVAVAAVLGVTWLASRGGKSDKKTSDSTTSTSASSSTTTTAPTSTTADAAGPPKATPVPAGATLTKWECPKADGSSARTDSFPSQPPPTCIDPAKTYVAKVTTSEGVMEYTLDTKNAPTSANNFVVLSRYHFYDGTAITRIDQSIDIWQTGSPKTQNISDPGPGYDLPDEAGKFTYSDGDVVMARGQGGVSGAQYFAVVGPKASALDSQGNYPTFAKITTGLDVAKKIFGLYQPCPAGDGSCLGGAPSKIVTIQKVDIEER